MYPQTEHTNPFPATQKVNVSGGFNKDFLKEVFLRYLDLCVERMLIGATFGLAGLLLYSPS